MKLTQMFKSFTTKQLSNSMGVVKRNYMKAPSFQPHYQVQGITYKAIDKIGQSLSIYEPQVKKANGDIYVNHPINVLAKNPNPRQKNGVDFNHLWAMLFEIYGETFWYLAKGESTGRVKEVIMLNPAQVELAFDNGELVGYKLHKENGQIVPLMLDEVIHDKRPNPFNQWRGMSVLERSAVYVDTEINTANFTLNYIKNNASPSGIVQISEAMERDTFHQFAQQWQEGYEGPQNAGKTAFIRGSEATFTAVGATLKDIDQKITRQMAKEDVLMMFDIPKPLLGATDDTGFGRGNVETLKYIFAENKIEPMMKRLDAIWAEIGKGFRSEGVVNVTHVSPIPEDKEFRLKNYETGVNVWLTVNEVRAEQGLEPITGGDVLMPKAPNAPATAGKTVVKLKTKDVDSDSAQDKADLNEQIVKTSEKYAKKMKRAITKFAQEQEKTVVGKINASDKSFEEWLFNVKSESERLASEIEPLMLQLITESSDDVVNWITGEKFDFTPAIKKQTSKDILAISGVYNADTLKALEATLNEGQLAGESLVKLKQRVESVYSDAEGYRAERIARTESLRTANSTAEQVYNQNGYSKVVWHVNPGACEFCATFEGREKEIGGEFAHVGGVINGNDGGQMVLAYDDIDVPPLHPNCTCSLDPEV